MSKTKNTLEEKLGCTPKCALKLTYENANYKCHKPKGQAASLCTHAKGPINNVLCLIGDWLDCLSFTRLTKGLLLLFQSYNLH